ncbi:ABC-2 type transport system ATP-binding protein [Neorhodopirellula lusitana]|uniref:ABC-2 type transport system ATP-binding protein n=1 Tax=Neorhodopirellula lusitana TaxID=445327 RepID=A0ABY1Q804_9BACT|nr:ATP-binding cassette domain-containing protein [Neorhodopirellula lusitana]SMP61685.1 ABC-2 type transport system ATP-binding protein [Neorhodopirellula lusitana]
MNANTAVISPTSSCVVENLSHSYGDKLAVESVSLSVKGGEVVAVLGKNGSGKTTLFRVLSTLVPVQQGKVLIDGINIASDPMAARRRLGIIFQSPSLDIKLTVLENMRCQGMLYGLRGTELNRRCDELMDQFSLTDRQNEICQTLSGGLKRRVELAKGLLHQPSVMMLDEPSTGLDPSARLALWDSLEPLASDGVAVMLTTHLMDEAAKASRVVLMDDGRKIADAAPAELQREVGDRVLTVVANDMDAAEHILRNDLGLPCQRVNKTLRINIDASGVEVSDLLSKVVRHIGENAHSITIGRASLEDVFVAKTGKAFVE